MTNAPWEDFYPLTLKDLKSNYSESMNKPTDNPWEKTTFVKQLETILDRRLRPKKPG